MARDTSRFYLHRPRGGSRAVNLGVLRLGLALGLLALAGPAAAQQGSIVAKVNDMPITTFDVSQRVALLRMAGAGSDKAQERFKALLKSKETQERWKAYIQKHQPKTEAEAKKLQQQFVESLRKQVLSHVDPGLKERALRQLIVERVQMQEAERLSVVADDEEVATFFEELAQKNGMTSEQFAKTIAAQGVNANVFRRRMKAQISWQRVLSRRFRSQVTVGENEIDQILASGGSGASQDEATGAQPAMAAATLQLQRVVLGQGGDETAVLQHMEVAEKISRQAKGCSNLSTLASSVQGARFENLGKVSSDALPAHVRGLLVNASPGDVTPPQPNPSGGLEIYAVCGKQAGNTSDAARLDAQRKIENEKLVSLAKGLINNLCSDAYIDMADGSDGRRFCQPE